MSKRKIKIKATRISKDKVYCNIFENRGSTVTHSPTVNYPEGYLLTTSIIHGKECGCNVQPFTQEHLSAIAVMCLFESLKELCDSKEFKEHLQSQYAREHNIQ